MDLLFNKNSPIYLNNYENKVFNNRKEYSNCLHHAKILHLLSPASSTCDVVRQRDTCVWLFHFPNTHGWVLGYGIESVSKNSSDASILNRFAWNLMMHDTLAYLQNKFETNCSDLVHKTWLQIFQQCDRLKLSRVSYWKLSLSTANG